METTKTPGGDNWILYGDNDEGGRHGVLSEEIGRNNINIPYLLEKNWQNIAKNQIGLEWYILSIAQN